MCLLGAAILLARSADAQDSRTIEFSAAFWRPAASLTISSDAAGAPGTPADLKRDLGAENRGFAAFAVAVRPARRHRLRLEYIPIRYDATAVLQKPIVFSGATYARGDTVTSAFAWDAVNVGYEYDFFARGGGAVGAIVEWKSTVIDQRLTSASSDQSRRTSVPAPALGIAVRRRMTPRASLFAEARGFAVPDGQNGHYGGRYVDIDAGGAIAVARHVAVRGGVRWLDIRHLGESDTARFSLPGAYVALVVGR